MRSKNMSKFLLVCLLCSCGQQIKSEINWKHAGIACGVGFVSFPIAKAVYNRFFSSTKLFPCVKVTDKSFDDFIGQDEAVKQAKDFVNTIKNRQACEEMGAPGPRGLFIEGASNNGKSLLAHIITAELDADLITVSSDFFIAKGLHQFESRLKFVCNFAKQKAKEKRVVLFIDNLELMLCMPVPIPNVDYCMKKEIEKLEKSKNLTLITASSCSGFYNYADLSLLGIEKLHLFPPNPDGRKQILAHYIDKLKLSPELSVEEASERWVRQLRGVSAGELKHFVEQAALISFQSGSEEVLREHFEQSLLKQAMGVKGNILRTEKELYVAAIHEAGHALATVLSGNKVKQLTIIAREHIGGASFPEAAHEWFLLNSRSDLLRSVVGSFGGFCAEKIIFGQVTGGPIGDLQCINNRLFLMASELGMGSGEVEAVTLECTLSERMKEKFDEAVSDLRKKCLHATMTLLEQHKLELEALADALLEKETLYEEEIYEIVGQPRDEVADLL